MINHGPKQLQATQRKIISFIDSYSLTMVYITLCNGEDLKINYQILSGQKQGTKTQKK